MPAIERILPYVAGGLFYALTGLLLAFGLGQDLEVSQLLQKARGLLAANDLSAARATILEVMEMEPPPPEAYLLLAQVLQKTSESALAIEFLGQGASRYPQNFAIAANLGFLYRFGKDFPEAVEWFERAYELSGRDAEIGKELAGTLYEKGMAEYGEGHLLEALFSAQKAVQLGPAEGKYHHLMGNSYFALRQYSDARRALAKATELMPERPDALYDLALVNLQEGRTDQGEALLKRTVELAPDSAISYLLLGRIAHNRNLTETALGYFAKAESLDPSLRTLHFHIGYAYKAMGDGARAVEELEKEVSFHPDYLPARAELGELYVNANQPQKAVDHLKAAVEGGNKNSEILYRLGKALHDLNRIDEALVELQEASRLDPEMAEPHYLMAQIYMKQGKRELAQRELETFKRVKKPM